MSRRFLASIGVLAAAIVVASLAPVPVAAPTSLASFVAVAETSGAGAQTATTAPKTWTPPRTPWRDPDLQGIWSNATITPLQRPPELAGKQVLTAEEAAAQEEQAAQGRVDRPPIARDPGTYNQFWFDRGTKVVPTRQTSLIVDPSDGRLPPLAPKGRQREEERFKKLGVNATGSSGPGPFDSWEDVSVVTRCITRGLPNAMLPGPYNSNYQILQSPGYVVLLSEMFHDARVIPLDGRPHLGQNIRQWMGDSRGRWEGTTLVVDVTNFTDNDVTGFGINYRGSETLRLHLVERFTRVDADTIDYQFTVDDPTMFTRPWTAAIPMTKAQGPIFEYACHEGNYAMKGILSGSRAQEKAAEGPVQKK